MAIAHRASVGAGVAFTIQLDITIPAAVQVGDLMVLAGVMNNPLNIDTPQGWTSLGADFSLPVQSIRQWIWYRFATAGDVGGTKIVPLIPQTGSGYIGGTLTAWSGVAALDVHAANVAAALGTSLTAPSLTTTVDDCILIQIYAWASSTATLALPTTFRAKPPFIHAGANFYQNQASQAAGPGGPTGTKVATASAPVSWVARHLAFRPAIIPGGWGVGYVRMGAN